MELPAADRISCYVWRVIGPARLAAIGVLALIAGVPAAALGGA